MTDYEYVFLALKQANISNTAVERIIDKYGDVREIARFELKRLVKDELLNEEAYIRLEKNFQYETILKLYEKYNSRGICFTHLYDENYPEKLRSIPDRPYCLFYKGKLPNGPSIAIVGARGASEYGKSISRKLARELSSNGIDVISGLALGVDACAHAGAIEGGGETYAVLACGVDVCYPRSNIGMYMSILDHGGVISENVPETSPLPAYFPIRNRIISARPLSQRILLPPTRLRRFTLARPPSEAVPSR